MYIKPCPKCSRLPRIEEGRIRANGNRFYTIHCPNYCSVLKPKKKEDMWKSGIAWLNFEGNYDNNYMYRRWNEELIDD